MEENVIRRDIELQKTVLTHVRVEILAVPVLEQLLHVIWNVGFSQCSRTSFDRLVEV